MEHVFALQLAERASVRRRSLIAGFSNAPVKPATTRILEINVLHYRAHVLSARTRIPKDREIFHHYKSINIAATNLMLAALESLRLGES